MVNESENIESIGQFRRGMLSRASKEAERLGEPTVSCCGSSGVRWADRSRPTAKGVPNRAGSTFGLPRDQPGFDPQVGKR